MYTTKVCLLVHGLNRSDNKNHKWGNPKPEKILGLQKLISSILYDVEKFAEFNSEINFQIRAQTVETSPEKSSLRSSRTNENNRQRLLRRGWPSKINACQCSLLIIFFTVLSLYVLLLTPFVGEHYLV